MSFYRFYMPSMLLSVILSILALVTLLPAVGLMRVTLFAPVSTVVLLGMTWVNCMIRAELKRKQRGY